MASRKSKTRKNRGRPTPRPVPASAAGARNAADLSSGAARNASEKDLVGLKPKPANNERVEDIAVFTNVGREQLSAELKLECSAVMEALDSVAAGDFALATERLKNIPRSSPYADWRLFIRGLCGFYVNDFETAKQNWQRLDPTRRTARIAGALLTAELNQSLAEFAAPPKRLVDAAKMLLHRSSAVAAAKKIMSVKHRDPAICFSPSQVAMLTNFRDDYRRVDADFVAKFSQACVYLASEQDDPSVFILLKKTVPGPPHDPHWNLHEFLYMDTFEVDKDDLKQSAEVYIETDLPAITQFSKEQKGALASCIYFKLAQGLNSTQRSGPFYFFSDPPDYKSIEQLLGKAIKNYRTNREAHTLLFDVLDQQIHSQRRIPKAQIAAAEKRLINAKEAFVSAFPSDIETSLELVDHYFSNDEIDKADGLVKQLSSQRLEAPLAKALPWKLKLLGAMRNSRKKTEFHLARESLAIADANWPTWLARTWLPFLKAALELRVGTRELFESLDKQARQDANASQVAGDFMTFAAMQQMNVPAAVIKPYRETITSYLDGVDQLPLSDLISIAAFFWDLSRVGLEHKAFRLQASKVGKAMCSRLNNGETEPHSDEFVDAICFCADRGFWQSTYEPRLPAWSRKLSETEPKFTAAFIGRVTKALYGANALSRCKPLVDLIQEAAKTEKDPFYRYRFEQVALSANELMTEYDRRFSSPRSQLGGVFDALDDDDSEEECQCAECQAERASEARARRSSPKGNNPSMKTQSIFDFGIEDDDDFESDDFASPNSDMQSALAKLAERIGPEQMPQFVQSLSEIMGRLELQDPAAQMVSVVNLLHQFGLQPEEADEFLRVIGQPLSAEDVFSEDEFGGLPEISPANSQPRPMTAEERRAADKKRRRELEKKKRS